MARSCQTRELGGITDSRQFFPYPSCCWLRLAKNIPFTAAWCTSKKDLVLHYDVGCKHAWEHEDWTVQQRLRCEFKTITSLLEALLRGADPHSPHLLLIPQETNAHRKERSAAQHGKNSKWGEYMAQAALGMEGALSLWQSHLPRIRPSPSLQRGGNDSSASFCSPPLQQTCQAVEEDAGHGTETHALEIIAAWNLFYFPMRDPNIKKFSDNLHHWATCTKQGTKMVFWGGWQQILVDQLQEGWAHPVRDWGRRNCSSQTNFSQCRYIRTAQAAGEAHVLVSRVSGNSRVNFTYFS